MPFTNLLAILIQFNPLERLNMHWDLLINI